MAQHLKEHNFRTKMALSKHISHCQISKTSDKYVAIAVSSNLCVQKYSIVGAGVLYVYKFSLCMAYYCDKDLS